MDPTATFEQSSMGSDGDPWPYANFTDVADIVLAPTDGNYGINEANVQKEIPRIDALAKELGCEVIDMHAALATHPEMLPDRVHPNNEGAAEMAKAAAKAIAGK